jgi:hypothetical protein
MVSGPREDPYRVLGLQAGAGQIEVARAYRALVRALHPDTNPDPAAVGELARVTDAYQYLTRTTPAGDPPARPRTPPAPAASPVTGPRVHPRGARIVAGPVHVSPSPRPTDPPESRYGR